MRLIQDYLFLIFKRERFLRVLSFRTLGFLHFGSVASSMISVTDFLVGLSCRIKSNCPYMGPEPTGECSPRGSF